jgi:predicted lipoprotein with Yx(FWY)xxD motif
MKSNYTKTALVVLLAAGGLTTASAQISQKIGLNPFNLKTSAALEIESTTKGFLPSRMNSTQRDAIVTPAKGLTIYNIENDLLEVNTGTDVAPVWKAATVSNPAIDTKSAAYTVKDSDYTILCDATTGAFTLSLPLASGSIGKVFVISKIDSTENLLTFSPALTLTKDVNVATLNYAKSFRVQSDGTNWNIID